MIETPDALSAKYQQKTDKQHILDNPDTYIGSIENIEYTVWLINNENTKEKEENNANQLICEKTINYIPALFKLFDEGIVNCRDHVIRMFQLINNSSTQPSSSGTNYPVKNINITISDDGMITMMNDGNGIDVAEHPEYKIWIPELIFGHLRTSTNYDKTEEKIVGGKNGFGFKLVLIWSTYGQIETVDHVRGLKYCQSFENNLDVINKPSITKCKARPYTKISFKPDYARFGIQGLSNDVRNLLKRRVYDISAITDKSVKVSYNSTPIPINNFQKYIDLYLNKEIAYLSTKAYESANERWEYAVCMSPTNEFAQVSFVNGIHTSKGGKHVDYILGQITRKLITYIETKKKVTVKAANIKEQLMLFIRCDIINPTFDSQTKDFMSTPSSKFGSSCSVTDKFIEKVAKMGVMDLACAYTEIKDASNAKKTDGNKSKNIKGIPKLIDANWAGTTKSSECMIIFCEGDSAKAGIVSGLSSDDRNIIGVYPMKGKVLNVRGESVKKISENKEIIEIKKILGLETGKSYKNKEEVLQKLRYGKVLFMTDQDLDGSHIKGLCINLFQSEWPSLSKIPGFIGFMNTPIIKVKSKRGNTELIFYNDGEYNEWKERPDTNTSTWNIKYYKGLGTSTGKEFREYFKNKKIVNFDYTEKVSDDAIDMVFNKKRTDDRKHWLSNYSRDSYLDTNSNLVQYESFIDNELIHFSKYDCDRSIPNLMDGLKISLRKILYSAFKKNLQSEIKVAQFTGYVSEQSGYHHGEASLNGAIVGMAQNFVGSNNINLFMPNGQFGTRLQGGKDSASERYIFTQLSKITRYIFPRPDDKVLTYLHDDGFQVEPIYYVPIIPMILVNGSKGIGTGFSTDIPSYNPLDIIHYLKRWLDIDVADNKRGFIPYYEGFTGSIYPKEKDNEKFIVKGKYSVIGPEQIRITELPVGTWTDDYKVFLETLMNNTDKSGKKVIPMVKDYDDMSKDTTIDIIITLNKNMVSSLEEKRLDDDCNGIEKQFKLCSSISTSNMHLFNAKDVLVKYNSPEEIIEEFASTRLEIYNLRKEYLMKVLTHELLVLVNKTKYIREILTGAIDLRNKKKIDIIEMLQKKKYDYVVDESGTDDYMGYKYLVHMPMDSVSEENVNRLNKEHNKKNEELENIKRMTTQTMWRTELEELERVYLEYKHNRVEEHESITDKKKPKKKPKKSKNNKNNIPNTNIVNDIDSEDEPIFE